jgi:HK97 family phage portal protein
MRNPLRALFEQRSAIGSPYELLQHLTRGAVSVSGKVVNEASAMNVAAFWTGVAIRSRLLSTLPIDVVELLPDGRSVRQVPNHPVARVLSKPNTWQTRSEFVGMLETHRVARGNGYAFINRVVGLSTDGVERDQVAELIPMHPDKVEVVDKQDEFGGPTTYRLHRSNGQVVTFAARDVLHVKGMSTDGRSGRSVLQDLREVLGGALATQDHANSLWSKDATPSLALKHPKTLGEKARKNLEESWEQTYGQSSDKRRIAVIEEGMEIQQLSLSPEDGQFLGTSQDLRQQLAAALMVPPFMMGLAEKATSWGSGIEQQQIGLLVFTLSPDAVIYEQRFNMDLISRPDKYRVKFNVNALMRGDSASRSNFYWRMVQMGAFSPNDVRAKEDMNPIANGDIYLQPTNMAPLGTVSGDPAGGTGAGA